MGSYYLCVEIAIPRLSQIWPDLAEKLADFWVKYGPADFLRGRHGLGCNWVDPYWCQDSFPGLVGPFGTTGGSVRDHFPHFPDFWWVPSWHPIIPLWLPIIPLYEPGHPCEVAVKDLEHCVRVPLP